MSREPLLNDTLDDEPDAFEAVNDDDYGRQRPTHRAEALDARRRVETLLEDRRLRRAIEDDWSLDEEE
jgi:hypothetical protein